MKNEIPVAESKRREENQWKQCLRVAVCMTLFVGALLMCGCVSSKGPTQIKKFSDAVALTATNAKTAFETEENGYVEEEISRVALDTNILTWDPKLVHSFLRPEDIQARLDVLEVLKLYAAKLSLLVGNASTSNLDLATSKFGKAVNKIDTNLVVIGLQSKEPLTSGEINIFTTAFNAIANWIITRQEEKAAVLAIQTNRQNVADICRLLEKDLKSLRPQLRETFKQTLKNDNDGMIHDWPTLTTAQKREAVCNEVRLVSEMQQCDSSLAALQSAITNLAAAHSSLDQLFTTNRLKASALIDQFSAEAQRISTYYNSLQTNK